MEISDIIFIGIIAVVCIGKIIDATKSQQINTEDINKDTLSIDLDKEEIVKLGLEVGAPMEISYSCYAGREKHCGVCESCMRRKRAFKKSKIKDLTEYEQ